MPQKTNLNISPYYDDFNKEDKFYKVLFKPGFPVQARELTQSQSILQNQIESFGSHIFKDGSMVIPGNINYDNQYYSVRILDTHLGVPVTLYLEQLIGLKLKGQTSGIVLTIDSYQLVGSGTEIDDLTIYVKYLESGNDNQISYLDDGEKLIVQESFTYGNTAINEGETVLTLVDTGASAIGSAVGISSGTYFIRGNFVDVSTDKIVLDPYSNNPSYRVGLNIDEQLITAKNDDSLYDNARGFSNFAAPGADRLKITTTLGKKSLTDFNDTNFIELLRIDEGEIKKMVKKSDYSLIRDYFATRTYDESGNYSVAPFDVQVFNSLNDGISNEGIFRSNEVTDQQNTPSDDLMCVKVSAGKAYVKGYDITLGGVSMIDVPKPRDKQIVDSSLVPYQMGTILRVNNVFGAPVPNINYDTKVVELYNQRTGSNTAGTGELVGKARVYSFAVSNASYTGDTTEWDLHLFDLQTFTRLVLNQAVSNTQLPNTSFVRGLSSGATGYATAAGGASTVVKLTQVTGIFVQGEQIIINEDPEISRSIQTVRTFGIQDVKSVYQDASSVSGYASDFVADTVLQRRVPTGFSIVDKLNIGVTGVATCAGRSFTGIKTDTIIRYQLPDEATERFNRITSVSTDGLSITVGPVTTIAGVCNGAVPTTLTTTTFAFGVPNINLNETKGLYAELGNKNVSDINLSNANLTVGTNITGESTDGSGVLTFDLAASGISSAFYEGFDAERYSVHYSNGSIEDLTADQFVLGSDGQTVTINGLTASQTNVVVSSTLKKQALKSKVKNYIRSEKLEVLKTAVGINTTLSGMDQATGYGLRVEDREISLNKPDVAKVLGVFESTDNNSPVLDKLTFPSGLNLDTTAILGEKIIGDNSDAVAQITALISATEVEIVYLTPTKFTTGEVCNFEESNISTLLQLITVGNNLNITNRFELDRGQREQFYDYSRLVRRVDFPPATRKVLVVYDRYDVPANDVGDFYTVASYDEERFSNDIPLLKNNLRATDTIDFRPRVSTYTGAESPFAFQNRTFANNFNPSFVATPNESSIIGYNFYLPRADRVILDTLGNLAVIQGTSSTNPIIPPSTSDAMEIATIELPAYLYNPDDVIIRVADNTRYTMRDIGRLEDRIDTLEEVTSLSLLELDTKTLQVQDVDGLTRFKTGFFVDDFKNADLLDSNDPDLRVSINSEARELNVASDFWSMKPELALDLTTNVDTADFSQNLELLDTNVQKTGDMITVAYDEVDWINQPLASRVENVNPFNMVEFIGTIELKPFSDNWVRTIEVDGGIVRVTRGRRTQLSAIGAFAGGVVGGVVGAIFGAIFGGLFGNRPRVTTTTERVLTSQEPDTHIRSRNVAFSANGLRPVARFYPFFDSVSGIDIVPKLLEISMTNGIFTKGETVQAYDQNSNLVAIFRIAQPDHKLGDINSPNETFNANPYNTSLSLGSAYSASTTVLNIDVLSMADEAQGRFYGYIPTSNVTLLGQSSGAQASVSNVRLVADTYGDLYGSFFFRDPLTTPPPPLRFRTGTSAFKLTSSSTNAEPLPGSLLISSGETNYRTEGRIDTFTTTIVQTVRRRRFFFDPLAQSFTTDETGGFVTAVDIFLANKDPEQKLIVELRTMELGLPTNTLVQDYSRAVLNPSDINISSNAEIPTRVKFPSPVPLEPETEYAIVLLAPTTNLYEAWIAQMGERTVNTQSLPDAEAVVVTRQYVGGSLFKSQNGTIWTPSQFEDLKFKLRKAQFSTTAGTAFFYNPKLETNSGIIERLLPNAIRTLPRKLKVGITTTTHASSIAKMSLGVQVSDATAGNPIQGYIERTGGPAQTLGVTNGGVGFDASQTYNGVSLYAITGNGSGATATIATNAAGQVSSASITSNTGGNGYAVGDVVGITTSAVTKGSEAQLVVSATNGVGTLYLNNVQGEEFTTGQAIVVYEGATATSYGSTTITSSATYDDKYAGNIVEIQQYNHGMQADTNVVTLANVEPDTAPILLDDFLDVSDQVISVANTTPFASFNGISTAQGYVKINNEIIFYNSITAPNQLGIGTRGVDGTIVRTHEVGDVAYKYELNGVDLRNINKDHNMTNITALSNARDIDSYYLEIDRGSLSSGDSQVSFTKEQNVGGEDIFASQNYQFNAVLPEFSVLTPTEATTITAQVRTVSGTSAGGGEVPFIDQGYEPITLNVPNELSTPRIVCSRVNENARLTGLPLNRSFTLGIRMQTNDPNLSPVLDISNATILYGRSRLNKPIDDYVKDGRSNTTTGDPHAAVYISNRVDLKNPATSLKVLVAAYRDSSADFRVLYQLFREDGSETELAYELFPGFDNLNDTDGDGFGNQVIDPAKNSGKPDAFVSPSNADQFKEYQFSVDDLDEFTGFKIKIVSSGTNEALAPRFKDFRALALA